MRANDRAPKSSRGGRLRRVRSLAIKESRQIVRDPSSILIAFVLPLILLVLFGYGVSLDLNNIRVGIVNEGRSAEAERLLHAFEGSPGFQVFPSHDRRDLQPLLVGGRLNAVLILPPDFSERLKGGDKTPMQAIIRASDANTAELTRNSIERTWQIWRRQEALSHGRGEPERLISAEPRVWFNEAVESRAMLLPGSIAVIMTLIGAMLTSLVVAREWERGTMEALLSTPVTRGDLLLGKFLPYFALGMTAMALVTGVSILVMDVPFRGSFWLLGLISALFLSFALGLGLFISSAARNQFTATLVALIVGFLPSFLLSGLVFPIDSMPWPLPWLTYLLAPRYFVACLRTLFLAGDIWPVILPNSLILALFAAVFLALSLKKTRTRID